MMRCDKGTENTIIDVYNSLFDDMMMTTLPEVKVLFKAKAVEINVQKPGGLSFVKREVVGG